MYMVINWDKIAGGLVDEIFEKAEENPLAGYKFVENDIFDYLVMDAEGSVALKRAFDKKISTAKRKNSLLLNNLEWISGYLDSLIAIRERGVEDIFELFKETDICYQYLKDTQKLSFVNTASMLGNFPDWVAPADLGDRKKFIWLNPREENEYKFEAEDFDFLYDDETIGKVASKYQKFSDFMDEGKLKDAVIEFWTSVREAKLVLPEVFAWVEWEDVINDFEENILSLDTDIRSWDLYWKEVSKSYAQKQILRTVKHLSLGVLALSDLLGSKGVIWQINMSRTGEIDDNIKVQYEKGMDSLDKFYSQFIDKMGSVLDNMKKLYPVFVFNKIKKIFDFVRKLFDSAKKKMTEFWAHLKDTKDGAVEFVKNSKKKKEEDSWIDLDDYSS